MTDNQTLLPDVIYVTGVGYKQGEGLACIAQTWNGSPYHKKYIRADLAEVQPSPEGNRYTMHISKLNNDGTVENSIENVFVQNEPLPKPSPETDLAEIAYWNFDSRRAGTGPWKLRPQSERDAFKAEYNCALQSSTVEIPAENKAAFSIYNSCGGYSWRRLVKSDGQGYESFYYWPTKEEAISDAERVLIEEGKLQTPSHGNGNDHYMTGYEEGCRDSAARVLMDILHHEHHEHHKIPKSDKICERIAYITVLKHPDGSLGYSHSGMLPYKDIFKALPQQPEEENPK